VRRAIRILLWAVAAIAVTAPAAQAVAPPDNAQRYEAYFPSGDGTSLHAEILRPPGTSLTDRTPVILSIGPYFGHAGQVGPTAPIENTTYTPLSTDASDRFFDFLGQSHALKQGYTFVMVDLRGFAGSGGCNDWSGPGEQSDVVAAVEWAGTQPWSTGKVGMYGKSYDGVTGIIGVAKRPPHLAAVVSQEPLPDDYRYLYMNGVRFPNSLGTPVLYQVIDASPGLGGQQYVLNQAEQIAQHPDCYPKNIIDQQTNDPNAPYWRPRNMVSEVRGSTVPIYMQAGFIEDNTKPDAMWTMFNNIAGQKFGAFGMWDHVRGNDVDPATGKPVTGRGGFIDEVMRFYDHFLKGAPADQTVDRDPRLRIQTSDGTWRPEDDWPPKDSVALPLRLRDGTYADDGSTNVGTGDGGGATGFWTATPPLPWDAHFAGMPFLRATVETDAANANLVADVYDIDPKNNAILVSRGAYLIRPSGRSTVGYELYGDDWKLPAGHRIGVLLTPSNDEWWLTSPSNGTVKITGATITLPFLSYAREIPLDGGISVKLKDYLKTAPFPVPPETVTAAEAGWSAPAPLTSPRPPHITAPAPGSESGVTAAELGSPLTISLRRSGRRAVSVGGRALGSKRAFVALRRGKRVVARQLLFVVAGRYSVRFVQRRRGTLTATVAVPGAKLASSPLKFVPR
jgi:predicted acyl esterase